MELRAQEFVAVEFQLRAQREIPSVAALLVQCAWVQ
ncbi:unnamed protein product [Urochloa humidicola]